MIVQIRSFECNLGLLSLIDVVVVYLIGVRSGLMVMLVGAG